ncbi:hypothetical protein [Halovivax limisalsi]|uniref:hypothetical protein n=1 Tax=Halovivax limisalsi TaxID=1453760 RepID=UPI001FFD6394|nr:hypothetical protein [Halovivax limisalsi]
MTTVYTTDVRENPDRGRTATGPPGDEGCDHERTVYVESAVGGSLTCQDCGTTIPAEADPDESRTEDAGLDSRCRWVLTRVGGRF